MTITIALKSKTINVVLIYYISKKKKKLGTAIMERLKFYLTMKGHQSRSQ